MEGQSLFRADGIIDDNGVQPGIEKAGDHGGGEQQKDAVGNQQLSFQPQIVGVFVKEALKEIFHESIFSLYSEGDSPTAFLKALLK